MNSKTIYIRFVVILTLSLFGVISVTAQESLGKVSSINDFSIDAIDYNPNGIKIFAFENALMLNFREEVGDLRCEVINSKGKVLLDVQEIRGVKESILNITSLKSGIYWVRVYSDKVEDFLKFSKK